MARKQGSHSDITGPKVRDAALRLIARHGCAAVSMRQIAAEVGVQAGALYNYTPDKQSLLFDLMCTHMDELLAALADAPIYGTAMARLEAFTRFHIRFHLPRRDQVFVSYMELRNLTPENFAKVEALRRQYEDALETILKDGEAEGVFALPDTRVSTLALIALLTGITNWYRANGRLSIAEVEEIYWSLVRKAVVAA
ncbi:transcriptional regulator, TetR family [Cognatiyoonia koreensis]|uniref:Transcriptional regulator, TetR family n=1 Tax=Cognatiyoonia koreensis TaxID=364200 RepID=A0A1I0NB48_9RHOB|nr:TetR/AcrR family transcriptional regulator [Cognatiyoonia koreensis]SEV98166.1 transcriptional regulator, TetR family [Cognatiyoonia koreensis]